MYDLLQVTYPPPPLGPPAIYMPLEYATVMESTASDRPLHYMSQYYRTDPNYLPYEPREQGLPPLPPSGIAGGYVERAYPTEYTSGGVHYVVGVDGCYHAYDNPSSSVSSTSTNPRTPSRLAFGGGHRRTPSNVSNASSTNTSSSNVNPSFRLEDEDSQYSTPSRSRLFECEYPAPVSPYYVRQNSAPPLESDRPGTLELSRMRGIRKYNYSPGNSSSKPPSGSGWGSGAGTPTNPTPPDSLTSEDSSYVSAKESSTSRVRFLPGVGSETLLDIPVPSVDSTIPLQASMARHLRLSSSSRKPSASELEREFLS
jgi:mitogen-activated protein kinase kinase kinase 9